MSELFFLFFLMSKCHVIRSVECLGCGAGRRWSVGGKVRLRLDCNLTFNVATGGMSLWAARVTAPGLALHPQKRDMKVSVLTTRLVAGVTA